MKKNLGILLLIIMVFTICSCSYNENDKTITTTEFEEGTVDGTRISMQPYLVTLGQKTENGSITMSQEDIDNADKINFMGKDGTVEQKFDSNSFIIDEVIWMSNEICNVDEYYEFVHKVDEFFQVEYRDLESAKTISCYTFDYSDEEYPCEVTLAYDNNRQIPFITWRYTLNNTSNNTTEAISSTTENVTSSTEATSKDNTFSENYCIVDNCYREGNHSMIGLSGEKEYYCDTHWKEIQDTLDNMESDVGNSDTSKHKCIVSECDKEGTYSIVGLNGTLEYYCSEHYYEMKELLEQMLNDN